MSEIAAFYVERIDFETWAVKHFGPEGVSTLMVTRDGIAAIMCSRIAEEAFKGGFEAGLVAQRYFPQEIRAFGYLPSASEPPQ